MDFRLYPLGDNAVIIELGKEINIDVHQRVKKVAAGLEQQAFHWMVEYVPAFATVTLFYNPVRVLDMEDFSLQMQPYDYVTGKVEQVLHDLTDQHAAVEARTIEIPVLYGGEYGPDLEYVAEHNQLTTEEVIRIHTGTDYLVYMIGFAPGFPYIGGMSKQIAAPRRESPRMKIPAGTVGIAGEQTGVYPIETPGGWQLIGRTPIRLFRPEHDVPSLLQAGDNIRFKAISEQEYQQWEEGE